MHSETIEQLISKYEPLLGANDAAFLRRIYSTPEEVYSARLRAIGFAYKKRVLDAGCGFGQWSVSLAKLNDSAAACDIAPHRVVFLQEIAKNLEINNLDVCRSVLQTLPYDDAEFEAVFCYGVVFCTPWRESLREMARVLQPGGRLYVNANELGWYVHLWASEHNRKDDYDPRDVAVQSLRNTLEYEKYGKAPQRAQILIPQEEMQAELETCGLRVVQMGAEGTVRIDDSAPDIQPFFQGDYAGLGGVYEVVAEKNA